MTEPEDKPTFGQPASPEGGQQPESPDAGQQPASAAGGEPGQAGAAGGEQVPAGAFAPAPAQDGAAGTAVQQPNGGQAPPPPPSPYADELPQAAAQPYAAPYGQPYPAYPAYPAQDGTQPYAAYPAQDGASPYGQAYVPPASPDATSPYGQAPNPYQQPPYAGQPYAGQPAGSPAPDGANPYAQPAQPGMPGGAAQQPGTPGAQGTAPQPYQPYAQAAAQQPPCPGQGGYPPYGGQPPYPYQPYPTAPVPPKKRKVWPWVLIAILVVFVLGIGGCVGCVACSVAADRNYSGTYDDTYDYGSGSDSYDYSDGYTLDFIKDLGSSLANTVADGQYSPGVYEVGVGKDMEPGLYYLGGSQTAEGEFYVFERMDDGTGYEVTEMVCYFGSYFAQLEDGDVIVYWGAGDDSRLCAAAQAPAAPTAPYPSGCYRVGTDIPAGTYTITAQEGANSIEASQEAAAYAMKDLEFDDDSIVDTKYVVPGGTQTITLTDGQYLELYLAVATPA